MPTSRFYPFAFVWPCLGQPPQPPRPFEGIAHFDSQKVTCGLSQLPRREGSIWGQPPQPLFGVIAYFDSQKVPEGGLLEQTLLLWRCFQIPIMDDQMTNDLRLLEATMAKITSYIYLPYKSTGLKLSIWSTPIAAEVVGYLRLASAVSEAIWCHCSFW